jgi:ribosomal protein S18 acetylase RimI-like enzyme
VGQVDLSPGVSLEDATWRDFRRLLHLERICFQRDSWPWIDVLAALTFPQTVRIKAELGDQLVGFVIGDRRRRKGMGWIASIGVHPDHRRRGIGKILLEVCEQELATPKIRLILRPSNTAAKYLYSKAGYREVDLWRRYYANGEDGLVMEKYSP